MNASFYAVYQDIYVLVLKCARKFSSRICSHGELQKGTRKGNDMRKRYLATVLLAGSLLAAGGALAAESQVGHTEMGGGSDDVLYSSIEDTDAYNQGLERLAEVNARQDEINAQYAPEIRTLEDGTQVQRTPTEYQCYHWNRPYTGGISYNNY